MSEPSLRAMVVGFSLAALCVIAACGGDEATPPATSAPEELPAPAATPEPEPSTPPVEPAAALDPASGPFACIAGSAERGKLKYVQLCATCHGAAGGGDGVASATLNPKPAKHNDGAYMNALSNEHLVKVITEGGPAVGKSVGMAPWGAALGTQGVLDVVAFVRTLPTPAYACP